jgi:hypothetical protein
MFENRAEIYTALARGSFRNGVPQPLLLGASELIQ